jgi:hypothetical protein
MRVEQIYSAYDTWYGMPRTTYHRTLVDETTGKTVHRTEQRVYVSYTRKGQLEEYNNQTHQVDVKA